MSDALVVLLCLFLLVDAVAHGCLLWLLYRIATGELVAQDKFKRIFQFVGLGKIPESPQDYPKF